MAKKKKQQDEEKSAASSYRLKTDAVDRLVNAENAPEVSEADIKNIPLKVRENSTFPHGLRSCS